MPVETVVAVGSDGAELAEVAPLPLKDQFTRGLDAPDLPDLGADVCLQSGVRALPELVGSPGPGRADAGRGAPHRRRAGRPEGVLREHRRGRADAAAGLLRPRRIRHGASGGGQVLDQRDAAVGGAGEAVGGAGLSGRADQYRRRDGGHERRGARRGLVRGGPPGDGQSGGGGLRSVQGQRRRDAPERGGARCAGGDRRGVRGAAPTDPPAAIWAGGRLVGRAAPDRFAAALGLYHWLVDHPGVLTGDSFFHLSALGEPLDGLNLCGAGRVVCLIDPMGDVYACPFVIDREFLAGTCGIRAGSRRYGGSRHCSDPCASRRARAPAPRAGRSTRAGAGAWRRSSSPGCRWTAPIPSACSGTGRRRWRRWRPAAMGGPRR